LNRKLDFHDGANECDGVATWSRKLAGLDYEPAVALAHAGAALTAAVSVADGTFATHLAFEKPW